jgi:hypothetical protein
VGVLGETSMSEHFAVRVAPAMYFGNKHLTFLNHTDHLENGEPIVMRQDMKSVYVTSAVNLIFASKRFNNHRPYIMAGVSIVHIGQTEDVTTLRPTMSYYGYVRGTIPFKDDWQFSPSLLYAHSGKSTDVIDLGCMAFYSGFSMNDLMLWGGLNFNFNIFTNAPQTALMIGGEWKVVRLGYAYEMGFGVGNYNTHELVLGFRIPTSSGKSKYNSAAKKKKR